MQGSQETDLSPQLHLSVATPPGWWDLPLDPATRAGEIRRLVARRMGEAPTGEQAEMAKLLEEAAAAAHASGAVLASQFAVAGDDVDVAASMTVAVRPLAASNGVSGTADDRMRERNVVVDTVEMGPAGVARRKRCLRALELSHRDALEVLSVEYSFPVEGSTVEVVANFSSPTVEASADLAKLFDALAATITFRVDNSGEHLE